MNTDWLRLTLPIVVLGLFLLFEMLRRRLLREKYAVIWIGVGLVLTVVGLFPAFVADVSDALGFALPANLLFAGGGLVLLLVSVQLSHEVGRLEEETRTLAEEVGLLRLDIDKVQRRDV